MTSCVSVTCCNIFCNNWRATQIILKWDMECPTIETTYHGERFATDIKIDKYMYIYPRITEAVLTDDHYFA
jgi:hypothetical protein